MLKTKIMRFRLSEYDARRLDDLARESQQSKSEVLRLLLDRASVGRRDVEAPAIQSRERERVAA